MTWQAAIAIAVPALVAIAGYAVAHRNNLRLAERNDRLDRVSRQLSNFYGPLLALSYASNASWRVFRRRYRPGGGFWNDPPPTLEEAAIWRSWMTEVFTPLNRQMRDVVVTKADLLDEDHMPQPLLDLCAHVASYEPVLKRWEEGDYSEHIALLHFPAEELSEYVSERFEALKAEQNALLGRHSRSQPTAPSSTI